MLNRVYAISTVLFDQLHHFWESKRNQRITGSLLVASFLFSILLIKLRFWGLLPRVLEPWVTDNIFYPIELAFSFLLILEVVSLVLSLANSVAVSMGKQFEILGLILLRKTFKDFSHLTTPISWDNFLHGPIAEMLIDATGALFIFVGLLFIYRIQRHQSITRNEVEQARFIALKKQVALLLLATLTALAAVWLGKGVMGLPRFDFFEQFYTVLIFSDILLVLVSLRFSNSFLVLFRNSGFAFATLIIRLGLSAPTPFNVLLGVFAILFVLALSVSYNHFYQMESPTRHDANGA